MGWGGVRVGWWVVGGWVGGWVVRGVVRGVVKGVMGWGVVVKVVVKGVMKGVGSRGWLMRLRRFKQGEGGVWVGLWRFLPWLFIFSKILLPSLELYALRLTAQSNVINLYSISCSILTSVNRWIYISFPSADGICGFTVL